MANTTMVKKVNVVAKLPIRTMTPVLFGEHKGISMSPANIFKCLIHRAIVDEVLPDGTLVRLDMTNYNQDNSKKMAPKVLEKDALKNAVEVAPVVKSATKIIKNDPEVDKVELVVDDPTGCGLTCNEDNVSIFEEKVDVDTPVEDKVADDEETSTDDAEETDSKTETKDAGYSQNQAKKKKKKK